MKVADLIGGKVASTIATVALAVFGLTGDARKPWEWEEAFTDNRPWGWIFGLAAFLVLHSLAGLRREQTQSRRLAGNREIVQSNVLHLIADLSGLVGREYDLWMIDLYLKKTFCV